MGEKDESFEGWCVVELMGHRRLAGYAREQEIAGAAFLRIDVPASADGRVGAATHFHRPEAVYGLTPTTEEIARHMAAECGAAAIHVWDLPPALREAAKRYEREERERLRALDAEAQPNADDLDDAPF